MGNQLSTRDEECTPPTKPQLQHQGHSQHPHSSSSSSGRSSRPLEDKDMHSSTTSSSSDDDDDSSVTCSHPLYQWQHPQHQPSGFRGESVSNYVSSVGRSIRDHCWTSPVNNKSKIHEATDVTATVDVTLQGEDEAEEGAIVRPNSDLTASPPRPPQTPPYLHHPNKRSITVPSLPTADVVESYYHNYQHHTAATTDDRHYNSHNHRMPHSPFAPSRRSESVPVNKSRRKFADIHDVVHGAKFHEGYDEEDDEEQDAQYLRKMYDSRTWEMYRRITEARKNQKLKSCIKNGTSGDAPLDEYHSDSMQELEQSQLDRYLNSGSPRSGHEMMFMFDFD